MKRKLYSVILIVSAILFSMAFFVQNKLFAVDYKKEIKETSEEFGIDPYLILAVVKAESSFKKNAVSSKGAMGLMQIMPATAKELSEELDEKYSEEKLFEPAFNIRLGSYYLSKLMEKFGCEELALLAYNSGEGSLMRYLESGGDIEDYPYPESQKYLKRIIFYKKIYSQTIRF